MTYGIFFIGIIIYIILIIITAEILYKRNKDKSLGFEPFLGEELYYDRDNAYGCSICIWFIILLIIGCIIKVITNWNIEI